MAKGYSNPLGIKPEVTNGALPNVDFSQVIWLSNPAASRQLLFAVPAGKKAILGEAGVYNNTSSGSLLWELKVGASYYACDTSTINATATSRAQGLRGNGYAHVLLAGEEVHVTPSATGMYISAHVAVFDEGVRILSPKVMALANGDNVLYECPVGYKAIVLGSYPSFAAFTTSNNPVYYWNRSGGSRNVYVQYKPNGGSAVTITPTIAVADGASGNSIGSYLPLPELVAGDQIILNTNAATATQFACVGCIYEIPA